MNIFKHKRGWNVEKVKRAKSKMWLGSNKKGGLIKESLSTGFEFEMLITT